MKKSFLALLLLTGIAPLAACGQKAADPAAPAGSGAAAAVVDGTPISSQLFEFFVKSQTGKPAAEVPAEQKQQLLDQLVSVEVAAQSALKKGLDKSADTAARLELGRINFLAEAALADHLQGKTPTEQELRTEYETQVAAMPKLEYHARHILVATEPYAQSVIDKLKKGAKFEDLARKESMDNSKDSGGDLGWFTPARMVPEFANAVSALKKGEITEKPVQTQYGWHVIRLEDTREVAAPDFEAVKERLGQLVQQKKVQAYLEELKKTAKIEKKI